jgi:hypothetical protein
VQFPVRWHTRKLNLECTLEVRGGTGTMDWIKVVSWFTLAVAVTGIVWRLAWLVRTRASDYQSEDEDSGPDGSRRESWSFIRYMLVVVAGVPSSLMGGNARWAGLWATSVFLVLAVGADLVGWRRRARARQG